MKKQAVLLFSGGVDSTCVAAQCAEGYEKLLCITYRVPGMINAGFSQRSFSQLKRLFGGRIEHEIIDIRELVTSVRGGIAQCIRDNARYGYFYSWCLGCKLAMVIHTIDYCRAAGIDTVLDGSNNYDVHALEQHACVKDLFAGLYKKNGIEFISPCYYEKDLAVSGKTLDVIRRHLSIYKDSTEKRVAYLKSRGIDLGPGVGSQYRATQPSCVVSVLFNMPRVILKLIKHEKPENFLAYIRDRYAGYAETARATKQD